MRVTLQQQLDDLRREKELRGFVYPKRVAERKMNQDKADFQLACTGATIRLLEMCIKYEGPFREFLREMIAVENHPAVEQVKAAFPGAEVGSVKTMGTASDGKTLNV